MCSVPGVPTPGSQVSVIVTRVNVNQNCGLVELWVNMSNDIKHVYAQMQEEIQLPKRNFCGPEGKAGDLCLVNVDEKWHRARIVSVHGEKYEVFLIDRAQPHSVTSEALAWGKDECFILPPEIESCVLANVLSVEKDWPERVANFLKSLPGKEFEGLVQHVLMPDRTILLDVPTISKHLCKEGVAKKFPGSEFKNLVLKCLNLPEEDEPMTTSNKPENSDHYLYPELLANTFESITVTEVTDQGKIFCELVIFSNAIKILTAQMNEVGKDKCCIDDLQPQSIGTPCAAKGVDGKWRRAVLKQQIASNDAAVAVFFVDEGKHELVQAANVKNLKRGFLQMPVVMYQCCLEGVRRDKEWTKDEIDHLKSLTMNQNVVARFERHVLPEDIYSVSLYASNATCINNFFMEKDVEMSEDAKQIFANKLILNGATHEVAGPSILPQNLEKPFTSNYGSSLSLMEMPLCDLLTVGASVGVKISSIDSPRRFWCQTSQCDTKLEVLMKDLQAHYASVHPKPLVESICVARNPDNNMWYRAKIIANQQSPDVEVRFIDYGQTKKVPLRELRPIDPTFLRLDAQAFQCSLFSLPATDVNYTNKEFHKFVDACTAQNSGLKCVIKSVESDEEGLLLNMVDLQTQSESASQVLAEKLATRPQTYKRSSYNIEVNWREKISISHTKTVHKFYGQLDRNLPLFQRAQSDIEKLVTNSLPSDCSLGKGMCLARYSDSNWHRGQVLETSPDLKVHFVDIGKTLALNKSDIRPFPCEASAVRAIPILAIRMGLFNIPEEVPQEVNEWFAENVVGHTFTMHVMEKGQNGRLMVELYDGLKNINAQVQEKLVNIGVENKQLCNGSKIAPVSNMEVDVCQSEAAQQNVSQKSGAIQNGGKDMEDWILVDIEPQYATARKESQEAITETNTEQKNIDDVALHKLLTKYGISTGGDALNESLNKEIKPVWFSNPEALVNQTVKVYASSISSPGYFWCQYNNDPELDRITNLAQKSGWAEDPLFPETLAPGSPCLALYSADNEWCRAQVISRKRDKFNVVFVDYGNEDDVRIFNVRPIPPSLKEIQPQAFLCYLENFEEDAEKWTDRLCDAFFDLLLDKIITLKILAVEHNEEVKVPQYTVQFDYDVLDFCRRYNPPKWSNLPQTNTQMASQITPITPAKAPEVNAKTYMYNKPQLAMNETVKAYASSITGPEYFWCQYCDTAELDKIIKMAQVEGQLPYCRNFSNALIPGSPCLALFSDDKVWYRAQVLSKSPDKFSVLFIDYGNEANIKVTKVRPLSIKLQETVPQGFLCLLDGYDLTKGTWDDEVYDHFYSLLDDNDLKVTPTSVVENQEHKLPQFVVRVECGDTAVNEAVQKYWIPFDNIEELSSTLAQNMNLSKQKTFKNTGQTCGGRQLEETLFWQQTPKMCLF
uniref:Tudor domain-containing protein n=1 Tax=Neogobius melanostomus TaxID=47308 RepID=A0A8C6SLK5_9GOBI